MLDWEDTRSTLQFTNKRRFPRFEVDRPIWIVQNWPDAPSLSIPGRCRVIGEGGLGAMMSEQFRLGEVVSLDLGSRVRVYAAVRSQRGFLHGFEFVLVRDGQLESIKRLCRPLV